MNYAAHQQSILNMVNLNGLRLRHVAKEWQADKRTVSIACRQNGRAIQFACRELQYDPDIVGTALKHGLTVHELTPSQKDCKHLVLVGLSNGWIPSLEYVSERLRRDREVVLEACSKDWRALEHASAQIKSDPNITLAICIQNGSALQYASKDIRSNKEIVTTICKQHGLALQYASDDLRADKEIVLIAVASQPDSLKYALRGLNQDPDCLIAAKLWDEGYDDQNHEHEQGEGTDNNNRSIGGSRGTLSTESTTIATTGAAHAPRKIVLSTRFSLNAQSSSAATQFTTQLKRHPYISGDGNDNSSSNHFVVYSPNAYSKDTCDPHWTRIEWPCRGTNETCQMIVRGEGGRGEERDTEQVHPPPPLSQAGCCWRYSFRHQLELAKQSNGFMIQLCDFDQTHRTHILGKGQQIETEMATSVGTKLFRVYQPAWNGNGRSFTPEDIDQVVHRIKEWYESDCKRRFKCDIKVSYFNGNNNKSSYGGATGNGRRRRTYVGHCNHGSGRKLGEQTSPEISTSLHQSTRHSIC